MTKSPVIYINNRIKDTHDESKTANAPEITKVEVNKIITLASKVSNKGIISINLTNKKNIIFIYI